MKTPVLSVSLIPPIIVTVVCAITQLAYASCDLQIASAGTCLADGTPGTPKVGDAYGVRVVVNVVGTPTQPFRIKWTLANSTYYHDNIDIGPDTCWWWASTWWINLDDQIPWSVTLDPDGISGDSNPSNNTASGIFTPTPPTSGVDRYDIRTMCGSETSILNFQPGSGTITDLWVLFGVPTTHGAQSVVNVTAPADSTLIVTPPYSVPVFQIARSNLPAATFQDTVSFVVQLGRMRVNPDILRTVTWNDIDALSADWTQWIAPDQFVQSTSSQVAAFVLQSLPADYRSTLTPYDTARALHKAVMKKLTYLSPPPHGDANGALQDGVADCGGFAALLAACLRNVGIPARRISGFWQCDSWQGNTQWHVRVEFHLPGAEWLIADPTVGNSNDPTGTYAYDFGFAPDADTFLSMDVGDAHVLPYNTFPFIQGPNWWWTGGSSFSSYTAQVYLQPFPIVSLGAPAEGTLPISVTNVPCQGSVILESSTNLISWSPLVTASASGVPLNYSFPITNNPCAFFRVKAVP